MGDKTAMPGISSGTYSSSLEFAMPCIHLVDGLMIVACGPLSVCQLSTTK